MLALVLVSQGVIQNFKPYRDGERCCSRRPAPTAQAVTTQTLAMGPAASQIAIKQLGTNGGGFFNVNSAHPFENPTPLSNFLELLAILLIPAALCYTFGVMVGDTRQGWAVLAAMFVIFVPLTILASWQRASGRAGVRRDGRRPDRRRPRNRAATWKARKPASASSTPAIWASATTAASNGSVNSMHDSFTPLGGLVPMWLMQLGEVDLRRRRQRAVRHVDVRRSSPCSSPG